MAGSVEVHPHELDLVEVECGQILFVNLDVQATADRVFEQDEMAVLLVWRWVTAGGGATVAEHVLQIQTTIMLHDKQAQIRLVIILGVER